MSLVFRGQGPLHLLRRRRYGTTIVKAIDTCHDASSRCYVAVIFLEVSGKCIKRFMVLGAVMVLAS